MTSHKVSQCTQQQEPQRVREGLYPFACVPDRPQAIHEIVDRPEGYVGVIADPGGGQVHAGEHQEKGDEMTVSRGHPSCPGRSEVVPVRLVRIRGVIDSASKQHPGNQSVGQAPFSVETHRLV